jgi:hypothetical protein
MPPDETTITAPNGRDPVADPPQPHTGYLPTNEVVEYEPGPYEEDDATLE